MQPMKDRDYGILSSIRAFSFVLVQGIPLPRIPRTQLICTVLIEEMKVN